MENIRNYKSYIIKSFLYSALFTISSLVIVTQAIRLPFIQSHVLEYVTNKLEKATSMPTSIEYIDFNWYNSLQLHQIRISNEKDIAFINSEKIKIQFSWLNLLFKSNEILLENAEISKAVVNLGYSNKGDAYSLVQWTSRLGNLFSSDSTDQKNTEADSSISFFRIKDVSLQNCEFTISDPFAVPIIKGFDYLNFTLKNINGKLKDMTLMGGSFFSEIKNLTCVDSKTGLKVHNLSTNFLTSDSLMRFKDLKGEIGNSKISLSMDWNYKNYQMSDFNHDVSISAVLDSININSKDLGHFSEHVYDLPERNYDVSGRFNGTVDNFAVRDILFSFGGGTRINLDGTMIGLPNLEETYMNLHFKPSQLFSTDLNLYFDEENESLNKLEFIQAQGVFTGFITDFVADAKFNTALGVVISDLNIKLPSEKSPIEYSGIIRTKGFNLSSLLSLPVSFDSLNLNCKLKGKGLNENLILKSEMEVGQILFNNYLYKNLNLDIQLENGFLKSNIQVNDPNLSASSKIRGNFLSDSSYLKFVGEVKKSNLKELKITDNDQRFQTKFEGDIQALTSDGYYGIFSLQETNLSNENKSVSFPLVRIQSKNKGAGFRKFDFYSPILEFSLNGKFNFNQVANTLPAISKAYLSYFSNNKSELDQYLKYETSLELTDYNMDFLFNLKNSDTFFNLYNLNYSIADYSSIEGKISNNGVFDLELDFKSDSLSFDNHTFRQNNFSFKSIKRSGDKPNFTSLDMEVNSSEFFDLIQNEKSELNLIWKNDSIQINNTYRSKQLGTDLNLSTFVDTSSENWNININAPAFTLFNEEWILDPSNLMTNYESFISFNNYRLSSSSGSFSLDGDLGNNESHTLTLGINRLNLHILDSILPYSLKGKLTTQLNVKSDLRERVSVHSSVDALEFENVKLGNFDMKFFWNKKEKLISLISKLKASDEHEFLSAYGLFDLDDEKSPLNFNFEIKQLPLLAANPFISEYVSNLDGYISSDLKLKGSIAKPRLTGVYEIEDGECKVKYLNTDYFFFGKGKILENKITLDNLEILDHELHNGLFKGYFSHNSFSDFNIDINGKFNNLLSLDTKKKDNELYFGKAYATGDLRIHGFFQDITLDANLTTNEDTKVYIPIDLKESGEQQSFINFVEFDKKVDSKILDKILEPTLNNESKLRYKINLNLNITPVANFDILFDEEAGDIITGKGDGHLRLEIDSEADMKFFGDFSFTRGDYNFTYLNLISKNFNIKPGSTISWQGSPYEAIVKINAEYKQLTSLKPIFSEYSTAFELNKKYPTNVGLKIGGELMSPNIKFDVDVEDYPETVTGANGAGDNFGTQLRSYLQSLNRNEQELNRQVLNLIVFKSFISDNGFGSDGSINNSVSEFVSSQITNLLNEVDDNLEISLDMGNLSDTQLENFQLRLSYSLLNGRLKITRSGGLGGEGSRDGKTSLAGAIGDWNVEIDLSKDRKWRLRLYNRTSSVTSFKNDATNTNLNNGSFKAGFSIMHATDFDYINELFGWVRQKKRKSNNEEKVED